MQTRKFVLLRVVHFRSRHFPRACHFVLICVGPTYIRSITFSPVYSLIPQNVSTLVAIILSPFLFPSQRCDSSYTPPNAFRIGAPRWLPFVGNGRGNLLGGIYEKRKHLHIFRRSSDGPSWVLNNRSKHQSDRNSKAHHKRNKTEDCRRSKNRGADENFERLSPRCCQPCQFSKEVKTMLVVL